MSSGYRSLASSSSSSSVDFCAVIASEGRDFRKVLSTISRDAKIILTCKVVRMFSYGFIAVILVIYLEQLQIEAEAIGTMITFTMIGDAVMSIFLTSHADKLGRKKTLLISSLLSIVASIAFARSKTYWVLLLVAIVGVISPSGNECGPFMSIELSILAQISNDADRSKLMSLYNLLGCLSSACGALSCGMMTMRLNTVDNVPLLDCYRWIMAWYAVLQVYSFLLFNMLGDDVEVPDEFATVKSVNPLTLFMGLRKSKAIVTKLSVLFALDSFANSLLIQSIVSSWFRAVYHTNTETLGIIVFSCNLMAGVASLVAVRLADRLDLSTTMACTSMPANLSLLLVPLAPNQSAAIALLCIRYGLSQMDMPTRNAYLQGVVDVDDRSAANGVTNVMRSVGAAGAPLVSLILSTQPATVNTPFYIAGGLKLFYDLVLMVNIRAAVSAERVRTSALAVDKAPATGGTVGLARAFHGSTGRRAETVPIKSAATEAGYRSTNNSSSGDSNSGDSSDDIQATIAIAIPVGAMSTVPTRGKRPNPLPLSIFQYDE